MQPLKRKVIIVDGVTNAGKTTLISQLRKQAPGSTMVKFSDYYQKHMQRLNNNVGAMTTFPREIIQKAREYNLQRSTKLIDYVADSPLDDFLIERLHPTDYVYQIALFNEKPLWMYSLLEDKINSISGVLIILTLDDNTLKKRMEDTIATRCRKHGPSFEIPKHILSFEDNKIKRDNYLHFFEKSKIWKKLLIDTSETSANPTAKEILEQWSKSQNP